MADEPSIKSIKTSRESFYGVPHINNFFYDSTQLILPYYPNYGVGNNVQFYSAVSWTPIQYDWDFGDWNISSDQNPIHIYALPWTYTVTLTVSNSYGADTMTKVWYLVVVPSYPSINSINNSWWRPEYQAPNFPWIRSIITSRERPIFQLPPVITHWTSPSFLSFFMD
jgi:hypothetical protein